MAEILTWNEGSAYIQTGNASSLVAYCRDIAVRCSVGRHKYRPPFAAAYTYTETAREATLNISQAYYSDQALAKLMYAASGGGLHVHILNKTPGANTSGGVYLYTGELQAMQLAGSEGQGEQTFALQGWFENWSAY